MKRHSNLWDKILDFNEMVKAFHKVKRRKSHMDYIMEYGFYLERNILDLKLRLNNGTWEPGPERIFIKYGVKIREIRAPYFEDRIVHHSLVSVINPIFEKVFINDSFACRVGKGNINAMKELHNKIRKFSTKTKNFYYMKADVKKFFQSINHEKLISIIAKRIKDKKVIDLCKKIILNKESKVGLPIGSLTSQLFANVYLNELDNYIKRELRCKNYIRYMDDFVILEESKDKLKEIYDKVENYLNNILLLELNPKTNIDHIKKWYKFCRL